MAAAKISFLALAALAASCGPVARAPAPPAGEVIAFGGGPGGAPDACFSCHGFAGQGDGATPRLAGLGAGYMQKQLRDYADGRRVDAVMGPIAQRLADSDARAVAGYYARRSAVPVAAGAAPAIYGEGAPERGVRACARCHGERGEGRGLANPAIAGQPRAYTIEQLRRFQRSIRRNDPGDVMGRAARPLTEAEIEAIAVFLEGQ